MRNTTMKDKLTDVLMSDRSPKQSKPHLKTVQQKPKDASLAEASQTDATENPFLRRESKPEARYITPLRRRNPFSVHAYPMVQAPPLNQEPEPVAKEEIALPTAPLEEPLTLPADVVQEDATLKQEDQRCEATPEAKETVEELSNLNVVPSLLTVPGSIQEEPKATEAPPEAHEPALDTAKTALDTDEPAREAPVSYLPPNLAWLEEHTPFADHLRGIVDDCRIAKSKVGFTLQQSIARQKELADQIKNLRSHLDAEEYTAEQQREALRQLDDTISACALVAEQSSAIDISLLVVPNHKHKQKAQSSSALGVEPKQSRGFNHRWSQNDGTACRRQDIVKFFEDNPGTNWTAPEIRKLLPPAKQAHAKQYLNVLLSALHKDGVILRIGTGIYRASK